MTCSSLIPYPPSPPPITLLQPHWPAWCSQTLQVLCLAALSHHHPQVSALSNVFLERTLSTSYKRATLLSPGLHVTLTWLHHHLPYIFYLFIVCPLILDCSSMKAEIWHLLTAVLSLCILYCSWHTVELNQYFVEWIKNVIGRIFSLDRLHIFLQARLPFPKLLIFAT